MMLRSIHNFNFDSAHFYSLTNSGLLRLVASGPFSYSKAFYFVDCCASGNMARCQFAELVVQLQKQPASKQNFGRYMYGRTLAGLEHQGELPSSFPEGVECT